MKSRARLLVRGSSFVARALHKPASIMHASSLVDDRMRDRILTAVRELRIRRLRELRLVNGDEPPSPSLPYVPSPPLPDKPAIPEQQPKPEYAPSPDPQVYPIHPNIPQQPIHAPEPNEAPPITR